MATGQLATLDNQIDTTTGTVKLRALFENPDELLYPNQFVNARLLVNTLRNTVRVPIPAVQRGAPGTYVYVINANNTVTVRPVKVGPADNGYLAVLSGLEPGDKVVTDGTDRLRDGAPVTVPTAQGSMGKEGAAGQGQAGGTSGRQTRGQSGQPDAVGDGPSVPVTQGPGFPAQSDTGSQGGQEHRGPQQPRQPQ